MRHHLLLRRGVFVFVVLVDARELRRAFLQGHQLQLFILQPPLRLVQLLSRLLQSPSLLLQVRHLRVVPRVRLHEIRRDAREGILGEVHLI